MSSIGKLIDNAVNCNKCGTQGFLKCSCYTKCSCGWLAEKEDMGLCSRCKGLIWERDVSKKAYKAGVGALSVTAFKTGIHWTFKVEINGQVVRNGELYATKKVAQKLGAAAFWITYDDAIV